MSEKAISQIKFELGQIEHLFELYAEPLKKSRERIPDLIEITAIASVLHSFYNGLENIFLSVVKEIDQDVPSGNKWHRDLLVRMKEASLNRKPVLTNEMVNQLADYMGFRHFYRHSYSFVLDWTELEKLVIPLQDVWCQLKNEIQAFLKHLEETNKDKI